MRARGLITNADLVADKRRRAHVIHHQIADFIVHKDSRQHPPKLERLVRKYLAMMADAAEQEQNEKVPNLPKPAAKPVDL